MLDDLKKQVCQANLELVRRGLVVETFGNASGIDRAGGCIVIKPSGVDYDAMKAKHMVVVSYETGVVVEGDLRPSSDTPTHLALYRAFPELGGVVHTHSLYATAWAQAGRSIPALGTTHADHFPGAIPCTRVLADEEIATNYEANTGKVIIECLSDVGASAGEVTGVLVAGHGPFAWGGCAAAAACNAFILEHLAHLASETLRVEPYPRRISDILHARHFKRKHGSGSYYGQEK